MVDLSDEEIIKELSRRLESKDMAYHDLMALTKKLGTLNDKLLESEKARSSFLSNIRNEINNPLTSVLTMCELITAEGGPTDYESLRSAVVTIYKEAFGLNFQLRNIFAAAELEAGDSPLSISKVDLDTLFKGIIDSYALRAREKNLRIDLSCDLDDGAFGTDPEKLEWVLFNLLSNAIEYSDDGKIVDVKAVKKDGVLTISIRDCGAGIAPKDQSAIFERFRQLDTGSTKAHGGHGLGLSITKASAELLGGTIDVTSRKGEGSTFTVTIPESAAESQDGSYATYGNNFFFEDNGESERF
ncbi:MAG: HAMP domain-containing sensor histidine kinase [Deltaproteobacteria bacterium]